MTAATFGIGLHLVYGDIIKIYLTMPDRLQQYGNANNYGKVMATPASATQFECHPDERPMGFRQFYTKEEEPAKIVYANRIYYV